MIESKMDQKAAEKDFPKLMIDKSNNCVVLFSQKECGQVVHSISGMYPVGRYLESWCMPNFCDFHGTITLTT